MGHHQHEPQNRTWRRGGGTEKCLGRNYQFESQEEFDVNSLSQTSKKLTCGTKKMN